MNKSIFGEMTALGTVALTIALFLMSLPLMFISSSSWAKQTEGCQ